MTVMRATDSWSDSMARPEGPSRVCGLTDRCNRHDHGGEEHVARRVRVLPIGRLDCRTVAGRLGHEEALAALVLFDSLARELGR